MKSTLRSVSSRNGRQPRLIIRPSHDDNSDESGDVDAIQEIDISENFEHASTTKTDGEEEEDDLYTLDTEDLEDFDKKPEQDEKTEDDEVSLETLTPFDTTTRPVKKRKPLNSTVVAEAFKFVGSLMESLGYGDVVQGITTVLPSTTAAELLERVDVGGWVSNYQERYISYPREFSMGYCYVEYGLYNVASEGIVAATSNLLSRVFKSNSGPTLNNPNRSNMPPTLQEMNVQGGPPGYPNMPPPMGPSNYISPMGMENSYPVYGHHGLPGNRRMKRGVTVSRSYSAATNAGSKPQQSRHPYFNNRASIRRVKPQGRTSSSSLADSYVMEDIIYGNGSREAAFKPENVRVHPQQLTTATTTTTPAPSRVHYEPSSSFVPTKPEVQYQYQFYPQTGPSSQSAESGPTHSNPHYYQYASREPINRSGKPLMPSLTSYARPRRHYKNGQPVEDDASIEKGKEGSSGGSLINIANMIMQTAMASGSNNGGGGNGGDPMAAIMQNALPLVSQVATSPMVQGMVSNLVTSFLTPPSRPPPPPPHMDVDKRPSDGNKHKDNEVLVESSYKPESNSKPPKFPYKDDLLESNKVPEKPVSNHLDRPNKNDHSVNNNSNNDDKRPGGDGGLGALASILGGAGSSGLGSMVSQMVQTYLNFMFSEPKPSSGSGGSNKPSKPPKNKKGEAAKPSDSGSSGPKDIVESIAEVAKPFFISYFGVVPGEPGFGKLSISSRLDKFRYVFQVLLNNSFLFCVKLQLALEY